jgi:hypothetical protein
MGLESEEGYQQVSHLIENHLEELRNKVKHYFPSLSTQMYNWVRNSYSESSVLTENMTLRKKEELCELQSDCKLKMKLLTHPWTRFGFP